MHCPSNVISCVGLGHQNAAVCDRIDSTTRYNVWASMHADGGSLDLQLLNLMLLHMPPRLFHCAICLYFFGKLASLTQIHVPSQLLDQPEQSSGETRLSAIFRRHTKNEPRVSGIISVTPATLLGSPTVILKLGSPCSSLRSPEACFGSACRSCSSRETCRMCTSTCASLVPLSTDRDTSSGSSPADCTTTA
jgi:hypothetical protein